MNSWMISLFVIALTNVAVNCAVIADDGDIEQEGLYSKSDHVTILTHRNFERRVYGQQYAMVVQFYNSYCGHCRAFAPKYKNAAGDVQRWKNIVRLATIDCSVEENNEICRQFEVMAYPTLRYFHENYLKGNSNIGERLPPSDSVDKFKTQLIQKLQSEKAKGHLRTAPSFNIASYTSYVNALNDVPSNYLYTVLVFENENSTIGSEIALDFNEYNDIRVKRVYETSELAELAGLKKFPAVVIVNQKLQPTIVTPDKLTNENILKAINMFLVNNHYSFPEKDLFDNSRSKEINSNKLNNFSTNTDTVYYSDLEKTLKTSLHTEITRYKTLSGEPLQALMDYLEILITSFPARGNLRDFLVALRSTLATRNSWTGSDIYETVKTLEESYAPVYLTNLEYVGCKGSLPKYRGYTCGLWTLFHTLTVNAAKNANTEGPKILKAMHGYVKHFFGCTECSQHFQAMAERNRIFDVKDNDKAVLWLWISHNEVNLRLAGDVTEDPEYPKIQFPSISKCPQCRLSRGAWNLPAVYEYLRGVYGSENIQDMRRARSAMPAASPFSNLDIGMLSLLYILSFIILILVIKYFLTKRLYRKRPYKHGRGKV